MTTLRLFFAALPGLALAACSGGGVDDVLPPDSGVHADAAADGSMDAAVTDAGVDEGTADAATDAAATDSGTPRVTLGGSVMGAAATATDAAWTFGGACGATGIYFATSASTLSCGSAPLSMQLSKPYVQVDLSAADVATYTAVADGACTTSGHVFSATFDGPTTSTVDATGGTVTITDHTGARLRGTLSLDFGADHVDGTFDVDGC